MENCGIDVATKSSSVCILDGRGKVLLEQAVSSDEAGLASVLKGRRRMRCVRDVAKLLVEAAHVLLTRKRGSCRLKRWGLKLAKKKGHDKARVAVARKIAVLLHHLWITGETYKAAA